MPTTPEEVMEAANALQKAPPMNEAERRNAASRCYYSFFHFANRCADQRAGVPPSAMSGPTHANLSDFFSNSSSNSQTLPRQELMKIRRVGILLRQCHKNRCEADYHLDNDFSAELLEQHHHNCEKGINAIQSL